MKTYKITFRTAFGDRRNITVECDTDARACDLAGYYRQDGEVITYVGMV